MKLVGKLDFYSTFEKLCYKVPYKRNKTDSELIDRKDKKKQREFKNAANLKNNTKPKKTRGKVFFLFFRLSLEEATTQPTEDEEIVTLT